MPSMSSALTKITYENALESESVSNCQEMLTQRVCSFFETVILRPNILYIMRKKIQFLSLSNRLVF